MSNIDAFPITWYPSPPILDQVNGYAKSFQICEPPRTDGIDLDIEVIFLKASFVNESLPIIIFHSEMSP